MSAWIFVATNPGPWIQVGFSHTPQNETYANPKAAYICHEAIECPVLEAEFFLIVLKDENHIGIPHRTLQEAKQTLERWKILDNVRTDGRKFSEKPYFLRYMKRGPIHVMPEVS